MANLKVRVMAATGGPTLEVQVPPPCSLQALKDAISSQIGQPTSSFHILLNKKANIDRLPNAVLSALGIINGDLLFHIPAGCSVPISGVPNNAPPDSKVLRHVIPSSTPTSVSSGDDRLESPGDIALTTTGEGQGSTGGGKSVDPASLCRELCAAEALQIANISQPLESSPRSDASPSEGSNNSNRSSSRDSAAGSHLVEPGKQNVKGKDKVQDTMDASGSGSGATEIEMEENESCPPGSPNPPRTHSSLPDILHRVLLAEYGKGKEQQAILVLAIHAVMLETGFVLKQPMGVVGSSDGSGLPGNLVNLSYTLPEINQASSLGLQAHYVGDALVRCQVVGNALVVYGCVTRANGSEKYRLSRPVSRHLLKDLVVEDNCTAGVSPKVMANISEGGKQDATPMDCQTTKKRLTHDNTMNMFCNVFELWKQVKDNLSLPLLTCMCEKAGLPPPASLLLLPTELMIKVLKYVADMSVATIGCVCSEQHHVPLGMENGDICRGVEGPQSFHDNCLKDGISVGGMDEEEKGCTICKERMAVLQRGKMDCCDHLFCFTCIVKWAGINAHCPLCQRHIVSVDKVDRTGVALGTLCLSTFAPNSSSENVESVEADQRSSSEEDQSSSSTDCSWTWSTGAEIVRCILIFALGMGGVIVIHVIARLLRRF